MKRSAAKIWAKPARSTAAPRRMPAEGYRFSKAMENPGFIGIDDIHEYRICPWAFPISKSRAAGWAAR